MARQMPGFLWPSIRAGRPAGMCRPGLLSPGFPWPAALARGAVAGRTEGRRHTRDGGGMAAIGLPSCPTSFRKRWPAETPAERAT